MNCRRILWFLATLGCRPTSFQRSAETGLQRATSTQQKVKGRFQSHKHAQCHVTPFMVKMVTVLLLQLNASGEGAQIVSEVSVRSFCETIRPLLTLSLQISNTYKQLVSVQVVINVRSFCATIRPLLTLSLQISNTYKQLVSVQVVINVHSFCATIRPLLASPT
jgi:hypothetical protein